MALVVSGEFFQNRPVLVTGATGFIGRRLAAALREQGARLRVLMRAPGIRNRVSWNPQDVEIAAGDLASPASLARACTGIDTVFHIAGFAHAEARDTPEVAARHWAVNAAGTFHLMDAAHAAGVRRCVFLSSVKAVGDPGPHCAGEDWDAAPDTPYGRAKRAAEERVLAVGRESGMHTVNLRPALVYGPGMKANLARLIAAVRQGWLPPLPETGNRRSLVHVDDVIQALLLAAAHPAAAGQTYFVTDGRPYSGRELYRLIRQALGRPAPRWAVPAAVLGGGAKLADRLCWLIGRRERKVSAMLDKLLGWACFDSRRIVNELGYQPVWDLERALPGVLQEMIRNAADENAG
ncbi:MAG TPA: NAD-dependent epimerase/dehydratase family protein [Candidatus Competibacteraceae bacterium]|nr:NAD-dependent epimerase/dehydratase family protein [Candidatus Competibacteraceae bacterium]